MTGFESCEVDEYMTQTMHVYWVFASTCMYLYFTKTDRVYTLSTRI